MKDKKKSQEKSFRRYRSPAFSDRHTSSLATPLYGTQEFIHDRLWDVMLDGDLRPGTKIPEQRICEAFGVSRTVIRSVLVVMEQEGVVTLPPNRGAYIAWISPEKSSSMFAAVQLIPGSIAESLAENPYSIGAEDRERVSRHLAFAADETVQRNARERMRLGAEFLILFATLGSNQYLASLLEKTVSLIMMAALLYQEQFVEWPRSSIQENIIKHVYAGNGELASAAIRDHLIELESSFRYRAEAPDKGLMKVIAGLTKDMDFPN